MTPLQKQYYKWILTRNFAQLNKNAKGQPQGMLKISSQNLVVTSGKMVLLDKLLGRLKETGHRVLIFSQMVKVLDIISEYMNRRGYRHQRLDGSTPSNKRHQAMERFNAPDSQDFAFLLSTRAGGLGINLATADTVLLFDSDWNPQNDLQAMARAHRIGQKDAVNIYRLVTGGSVEEDILERAKSKMVLDHLVIQKMDTSGRTVLGNSSDSGAAAAGAKMFKKDELAAILKFGAEDLFKTESEDTGKQTDGTSMTDEDLDAILARAEEIEHATEGAGQGAASDLLSSFKVATFKSEEDDAAFWDRLIPENMRPKQEEEVHQDPELRIDRWPQAVDSEGRLVADESAPRPQNFPHTLSKKDALQFIKCFKKYPHAFKLRELANDVGGALTVLDLAPLQALWYGLLRGCEKAVESFHARLGTIGIEKTVGSGPRARPPEAHLDFFGVDVKARDILALARQMRVLDERISAIANEQGLAEDAKKRIKFTLLPGEVPAVTAWMRGCGWTIEDDSDLLIGAYRYGVGEWARIYNDPSLSIADKISPAVFPDAAPSALPKASHLETRVYGILRHLEKSTRPQKRKRQDQPVPVKEERSDESFGKELGDTTMVLVRKLRTIQRKGSQMGTSTVVNKTRKYMESIGERIDEICEDDAAKLPYWQFVSRFTENSMSGEKLKQVYEKLLQEKEHS
eukprot:jgi/Picre1/31489/NNA_006841.t1